MTSILKVDTLQDASGTGTPYIKGAVLQVKQGISTSLYSTSSTSYVSGGLFVQITPKSTSSKILVSFNVAIHNSNTAKFCIVDVAKNPTSSTTGNTALSGGTLLSGGISYGLAQEYNSAGGGISTASNQVLDSPSTTSQITYLVVYKAHDAGTAYFNANSAYATVTAMEIGG